MDLLDNTDDPRTENCWPCLDENGTVFKHHVAALERLIAVANKHEPFIRKIRLLTWVVGLLGVVIMAVASKGWGLAQEQIQMAATAAAESNKSAKEALDVAKASLDEVKLLKAVGSDTAIEALRIGRLTQTVVSGLEISRAADSKLLQEVRDDVKVLRKN